MFCIKSDEITLRSIEMYGLVTVWTTCMHVDFSMIGQHVSTDWLLV